MRPAIAVSRLVLSSQPIVTALDHQSSPPLPARPASPCKRLFRIPGDTLALQPTSQHVTFFFSPVPPAGIASRLL